MNRCNYSTSKAVTFLFSSNNSTNNHPMATEQANLAPVAQETAKRKRNAKPLPLPLAGLTVKDKALFSTAMECDPNPKSHTHGQEFLVAQAVTVASGDVFLLDKLSIDQTRTLARNVGASAVGSLSKFQCRKAIACTLE